MGATRQHRSDQNSERGDQRVRFRARRPPERAAGPFRLYGLRHRRRGHAARQPRGFQKISVDATSPQRRLQGRYLNRAVRNEIQLADLRVPDRRQPVLPSRWRTGGGKGGACRQSSADAVDLVELLGRRRHQGAWGAGLVPALCFAELRGRKGADQTSRRRRLSGADGDGGPDRRPQSGNAVPADEIRHPRMFGMS